MGIGASHHQTKLDREFGGIGDGDGEQRFFGLENFGNTCYCNSVLQARSELFFVLGEGDGRILGLIILLRTCTAEPLPQYYDTYYCLLLSVSSLPKCYHAPTIL